jgi:anti-sigma factor RsiW
MSVDIHALSGAYAVGAVDDLERASFARHLSDCESCRAEVDSLREAAALLTETVAVEPPASLRDSVLADIQTVRPLPPLVANAAERGRATRRRFPALVAAAAALIAFGAVGTTIWHPWSDDTSQGTELSASEQIIQAKDAEEVVVPIEGGGSATVVRSKSLNRAVMQATDMPAAPSGHDYALWLQHDDTMVAAGHMAGGTGAVILEGDPASASGFGITVEEAGTDPSEPSGQVVAVVPFENA